MKYKLKPDKQDVWFSIQKSGSKLGKNKKVLLFSIVFMFSDKIGLIDKQEKGMEYA
jgi:hypothetical protein